MQPDFEYLLGFWLVGLCFGFVLGFFVFPFL